MPRNRPEFSSMSTVIQERYQTLRRHAEKRLAEHASAAKIRIQYGSATCEHAAGSLHVAEELRRHLRASGRDDIALRRTGCTGRCSREPILGVFVPGQMPVKYERVDRDLVHEIFVSHIQGGEPLLEHALDHSEERLHELEFLFCTGKRCAWAATGDPVGLFRAQLEQAGVQADRVKVSSSSCFGSCSLDSVEAEPHILVRPAGTIYRVGTSADLEAIVREHVLGGHEVERLKAPEHAVSDEFLELYGDLAFFNRQTRVALRNNGVIDPESFDEYLHFDGFRGLAAVLERGDPDWVIAEIQASQLRGRGGAGYPTGLKWKMGREAPGGDRFLICNADEGDPGAFMDRSMLESDPFNVLEGMLIGAHAIGARRGFVYVRAEYPLAIRRVENAIRACREQGLVGSDIMGSDFCFDVEIRYGAGAFVCGEETALIRSIEGERGQPRVRPPYPTERGLWGRPTVINNVETFANVTAIINYGSRWFRNLGTEKSGGTKVFALAGKVRHTGLVEVPMGTTLGEIVNEIGGGVAGEGGLRAIQTGGPAGGCIPASKAELSVDYETLSEAGSIMGSGGMIVLAQDDCMVDLARYYMEFSQDESCGKCVPCREGTTRMLEILDRMTTGRATAVDLEHLERLAQLVRRTSLCGLGRAAPNPVLSTLEHYREEYLAHVEERRCPSLCCKALIRYDIDEELCTGCRVCARSCPAECISGERRELHVIDQERCVRCGRCFEICRFDAVGRR